MSSEKIIRLSKSCIGEAEKRAVLGVLDREYLGMGAEVQQFEQALTEFFGRPAVCVVNGTAALHLALQACGIGHGDEVLVQSLTYVASFQAISATGATPIACDIDPNTLTLDCRDAEKRVTPRTKGVMPVHYGGGVGNLDEIYAFARKYGLRVIEDAAHAFGTTQGNRRIGGFGDVSCFSFDGIKNITSGEGGCIVTNDRLVLEKVRDARLLGVEKDTEKRYQSSRSWEFNVSEQGWRYHMSNLMAAIGLSQLQRFPQVSVRRQQLASRYDSGLAANSRVIRLLHDYSIVVPHIYVIAIRGLRDRGLLRRKLLEIGIETGVHYFPNHRLSYFRLKAEDNALDATDSVFPELLTLPLHPGLSDCDVDAVVAGLCKVLDE